MTEKEEFVEKTRLMIELWSAFGRKVGNEGALFRMVKALDDVPVHRLATAVDCIIKNYNGIPTIRDIRDGIRDGEFPEPPDPNWIPPTQEEIAIDAWVGDYHEFPFNSDEYLEFVESMEELGRYYPPHFPEALKDEGQAIRREGCTQDIGRNGDK
jgi:hypothetical protein